MMIALVSLCFSFSGLDSAINGLLNEINVSVGNSGELNGEGLSAIAILAIIFGSLAVFILLVMLLVCSIVGCATGKGCWKAAQKICGCGKSDCKSCSCSSCSATKSESCGDCNECCEHDCNDCCNKCCEGCCAGCCPGCAKGCDKCCICCALCCGSITYNQYEAQKKDKKAKANGSVNYPAVPGYPPQPYPIQYSQQPMYTNQPMYAQAPPMYIPPQGQVYPPPPPYYPTGIPPVDAYADKP